MAPATVYRGDLAIRGDTIARIAPSIDDAASRVIDVRGLSSRQLIDLTRMRFAAFFRCRRGQLPCGRA